MVAAMGRAARLGERSLGHPDPGAVSAAMLIEEICSAMRGPAS
jgi:dihydroxyacetone kinase-like protein